MVPPGVAVLAGFALAAVVAAAARPASGEQPGEPGALNSAGRPTAPRLIDSTPALGEWGIDPGLGEIRLVFDQDMQGGFSWTGSGADVVPITGRPRWLDRRTCVAPVTLAAGKRYRIGLNSYSRQNFRSVAGLPLLPIVFTFETRAADSDGRARQAAGDIDPADPAASATEPTDTPAGSGRPPTATAADADAGDPPSPLDRTAEGGPTTDAEQRRRVNTAALAAIERLIDERYSYRDRLNLNWAALWRHERDWLLAARTDSEWSYRCARALEAAADLHLKLYVGDAAWPTFVHRPQVNFSREGVARVLPQLEAQGRAALAARTDDDILYLAILGFDDALADQFEGISRLIDDSRDAKAIILDVRPNGGGDERLARQIAGHFVDRPTPYARHQVRNPDAPGGFDPPRTRVVRPRTEDHRFAGPVAVLIGPACVSSCESFVQMMQAAGATLVGAATPGSSANPRRWPVAGEITASVPSWQNLTVDGRPLEGVGIAPHVAVAASASDFRRGDPVLERALAHLRRQSAE